MQDVYTGDFMLPAENIAGKIALKIASVNYIYQQYKSIFNSK
jgi:hypothetical protein